MKKIKLFLFISAFAVASFAGYSAYDNATMTDSERLLLVNVEALVTPEENMMIKCDNSNYMQCSKFCNSSSVVSTCTAYYYSDTQKGDASLKGTCTTCGTVYQ